ncbi:tyrosine-type recombinase/integrase [Gilliamella sp. Nev3-1]|uniref:tyrosine-type recombinase/integrase n=1 Tax=Gilliamella sp. Nev3-1 TaxID=3120250 RepID=UPI00080EAB2E|nr:tyrosine-type recombinase/integrase [Gilliamella apicola]OCG58793.1 hypothetical protein A9G40_08295 [Gilliamella apicola]
MMIKSILNIFYKKTLNEWLNEFQCIQKNKQLKQHTLDNKNSLIKVLRIRLGRKSIQSIKTLELADIINQYINRGTNSAAKSMYLLLKEVFREAYFNGWIEHDPTIPLRNPKTPVKRSRLTFDEFEKILNHAKKANQQYIYQAMILAVLTGQRRSDIAKMKRSDIKNGFLFIEQYKTNEKIALPLNLYCEKMNMTLEYAIKNICTGNIYLIENNGQQVQPFSLTRYFAELRDIVFYDRKKWSGDPASFHELRSLSERLYREQGLDTMTLLGHKSQKMTDKYHDSRGREWRYLKI